MCFNSFNMSCAVTAPDTPSLGFPLPQQRFHLPARGRGGLQGPKGGMDIMMLRSIFHIFFLFFWHPRVLKSLEFGGFPSAVGDLPRAPEQVPASSTTCLLNFYDIRGKGYLKAKLINACKTLWDPRMKGAIEMQFIL